MRVELQKPLSIESLYRDRARDTFLQASFWGFLILLVLCWTFGDFGFHEFFEERRAANIRRFIFELLPYPLQQDSADFAGAASWAWDLLLTKGIYALLLALCISIIAITVAGLLGVSLGMLACRDLIASEPFEFQKRDRSSSIWLSACYLIRCLLMFLRSIPEYIWAFILLTLLGPTTLVAIVALAIHNTGVLGKLYSEIVEDLGPAPLRALRELGASRGQIVAAGIFPLSLGRFFLFIFYRWETCVREASVLGLIGVVSLGYWIQDARSRNFYDEMFFFVILGTLLVVVGDLLSEWVRSRLRN